MKECFRKNDTGIAMIILKYAVDPNILAEALAKTHSGNYIIKVNNSFENYFLICGVWRNIRRIKQLDFVDKLLFECNRKPLIQEVPC
ncbi:MAG: hypothetical protein WD512_19635 [Candidatus Paceibacterota bacterium]